jgi:UDP-glucose 4-epimerase
VVTGGAGFIGSRVVATRLANGDEVVVFDNLTRGSATALPLGTDARCTLIEADIRDPQTARAIADLKPDVVIHCAALHYIPYCIAHPEETIEVNVEGTRLLLEALDAAQPRVVVFCSSAAVYGFAEGPRSEPEAHTPVDIYGESKSQGEALLTAYAERNPHTRAVAARLFNVYGPRDTNPHVVPALVEVAVRGEQIRLGNLWPLRDYVHVEDVAAALLALSSPDCELTLANVGTGIGHSVQDLVDTLEVLSEHPLEIVHDPSRERANDGHLLCDPKVLKTRTGWRPTHDLRSGLRSVLEDEVVRAH